MSGEFHTHDGWFWSRDGKGVQIRIGRPNGAKDPEADYIHELDADAWASVVSSMSAHGETYETWMHAKEFHLGVNPSGVTSDDSCKLAWKMVAELGTRLRSLEASIPNDAERELLWQVHQKLEILGWDTDEEGLAMLAALDRAWRCGHDEGP